MEKNENGSKKHMGKNDNDILGMEQNESEKEQ